MTTNKTQPNISHANTKKSPMARRVESIVRQIYATGATRVYVSDYGMYYQMPKNGQPEYPPITYASFVEERKLPALVKELLVMAHCSSTNTYCMQGGAFGVQNRKGAVTVNLSWFPRIGGNAAHVALALGDLGPPASS